MASLEGREARRRKIVERGSDRLALITGRIQNLNPNPPQSPLPPTPHDDSHPIPSSQPLIAPPQEIQPETTSGDEGFSGSVLPKHDSDNEFGARNVDDGEGSKEPQLCEYEVSCERRRSPASEVGGIGQSSTASPIEQNLANLTTHTGQRSGPVTHKLKTFFTPNQISTAITAIENSRILCSIIIAFLVVLSHLGIPLLGSNFVKSTILSRPLYLVLLTNLTVLLARLLQGKQRGFGRDTSKVPLEEEYGLAEQLSKALEIGLLLQNAITALLMDCSVYTVIIICGLAWCRN